MALLKIDDSFDLDGLPGRLQVLPKYARPLFLRLASTITTTATFKPKRKSYLDQGFDPALIDDPLYVFDSKRELYVALDAERYASIRAEPKSFLSGDPVINARCLWRRRESVARSHSRLG